MEQAEQGFKWKHRYSVVIILALVWIISYMDRMVISMAIPYIAKEFGLTPIAMGGVLSSFFLGYACVQAVGGVLADRFGARKVLTFAILWWSAFTAFTGLASNLFNLLWIRLVFGLGEGIGPAAAFKAVAVWSPAKQRGTNSQLTICACAFGQAWAPLFVAAFMALIGWRGVFYTLAIPGLILAALVWYNLPDNPAEQKGVSQTELDELKEDVRIAKAPIGQVKMSFWQVMLQEPVWKSTLITFFALMATWGYASWLPSFLVRARNLSLGQAGIAASLPYFVATVAWALGGWLSDNTFKHNRRVPVIAGYCLAAICFYMLYHAQTLTSVIVWAVIGSFPMYIAQGGLWSLPMSAVPKEITGRAMGIVNTGGQAAAFLSSMIVGVLVQMSGGGSRSFDSTFMFFIACFLTSSAIALSFPRSRPSDEQKPELRKAETAG